MAAANLTAERLRELLDYDPVTGAFQWREGRGAALARSGEKEPGFLKRGYRIVELDGVRYKLHRLAWFFVNGYWPGAHTDHINGIKTDNRISNLRDVSAFVNAQNRRAPNKNNIAGRLGVAWDDRNKFWYARITVNRKTHYLGTRDTKEGAAQLYLEAKRRLHEGCTI